MRSTNILLGFIKTMLLFATGRIVFFNEDIGKEIVEYEQTFTIFRSVRIKPFSSSPKAIFKIRFKPANMGIEQNKRFSKFPMLIFMGFRGFKSKYWAVNEKTGLCLGIYEWDTLKDAENYSKSIAVKFMTKRSSPGSVKFEILEQHR
ncbi:MAG: hypothetical protein JL56_06075 [Desulfotomaculum sp. BICA1-6]|nr:MAG: hypothetical protein JL56_06075 [Desulfotomaculum sp. BICA1-6]